MFCLNILIAVAGQTDCIVEGEVLKLGGPFLQTWQKKHLKLYPNRLEFYHKTRDGQVARSKTPEVCLTFFMDIATLQLYKRHVLN